MLDFTRYPKKDNVVYIYVLIDPRDNRIRYVGQCVYPRKRHSAHCIKQNQNNHRSHWLNLLRSLDIKPDMEIIEICNESNWEERETYLIEYYRDILGCNLVNGTKGGEGLRGYSPSKETRDKISLRTTGVLNPMYGKNHTEETIQRIRESKRGKPNKSKGTKRPCISGERNSFYGKNHTEDTKQKIRDKRTGIYNGEKIGGSILTEDNVRSIRRMLEEGIRGTVIGRLFGVHKSTIYSIKYGQNWKHVK